MATLSDADAAKAAARAAAGLATPIASAPTAPTGPVATPSIATPGAVATPQVATPPNGATGIDTQGNIYTYDASQGTYVSNATGKPPSGGIGVSPIQNGQTVEGPLGVNLNWDAASGKFVITDGPFAGQTRDPTQVTGQKESSSGTAVQGITDLAGHAVDAVADPVKAALDKLG